MGMEYAEWGIQKSIHRRHLIELLVVTEWEIV